MLSKVEIRNQSALARQSAVRLRSRQAIGFTLIELLVVISIIALLVGILLPSIRMATRLVRNAQTVARVAELAGGCRMYRTENEYYPGQRYSNELKGSSGNFTGSQWLAKSLFTDPDVTPPNDYPRSKYAPVKTEDLIDPVYPDADKYHTISDRNKAAVKVLPILYYPARPGVSGLTQYKEADNSDHTAGHVVESGGTSFSEFIKDERFGQSDTPYNPGAFLIIAAGMDRLYFTDDDICYPFFR